MNAGPGYADGQSAAAQFNQPAGLAVDGAGNLYVADTRNYAIRKITPGGTTTTFAGNGSLGEVDGTGASARFGPIKGLTMDSSGNLYVSDWVTTSGSSGAIRKITPAGVVSTIASSGLAQPLGLAVDASGNLYVSDSAHYVIRRITSGGTVSTYAGTLNLAGSKDGALGVGQLGFATGVVWDGSTGNLYVTDSALNTIRRITPDGAISTYAGTAGQPGTDDGAVGNATFTHPSGIAIDSTGNLFVLDDASLLREISAGNVSTLAGGAGQLASFDGAGQNARFNSPFGIATGANGAVAVADTGNSTIRWGVPLPHVAPIIQFQPSGETAYVGGTITLSVTASGSNLSYQWSLNGIPIQGATSSVLNLAGVTPLQAGAYTVAVTGLYGTTTSNPAAVSVQTSARIVNLSTLANVGTGANDLVAGFVVSGASPKQLLVRAAGPALAQYSVANPLSNPVLTVYDSHSAAIATNSGWGNSAAISAAFAATGAFAFPANSRDAALLLPFAPALYSATVDTGNGSPGAALVEVYDDDGGTPVSQLINISSRAVITPSAGLTVGFVISGTTPMTVLIRGIGPALTGYGIANPVGATSLTLFDSNQAAVTSNSGWGGSATLASAFSRVGAFALPTGSADSALLVTLQPGLYTAHVASADSSSGIGLVEVYEVQ